MAMIIRRLIMTAAAGAFGYMVGWVCSAAGNAMPKQADYPFLAERAALPHHVPEHSGGISFRFAMAHDVIHERFAKHGPAHYRERDRITRAKLADLSPDDPAGFPLRDDLAAGLERLGRSAEAVEVMRDKLDRQLKRGLAGRDLYTSDANLGTFLIHASAKQAMAGEVDARAHFREGVDLVRRSVEVNPGAHFGRERWQAAIAEFLLASMDNPALLNTFDYLGNRLDLGIQAILEREGNWVDTGYGRPYDARFAQGKANAEVPGFFEPGVDLDAPSHWPELSKIRAHVTKVGAEEGWDAVPVPSHRKPAPFDEPMLGMIGMWRQGGGANPHFCLAMGETMLRAGQRYIAWAAFERAGRMADRFWPDPPIRQSLRDHCRARQAQIESTLAFQPPASSRRDLRPWQSVSPPPDPATIADLRAQFDRELAFGEGYQRAYQEYEAKKIAAGVPITDEHFFDEFQAGRPPIASETGPEEWFVGVPLAKMNAYAADRRQAWGIFGAGVAALGTALLMRWRSGRRRVNPTHQADLRIGVPTR